MANCRQPSHADRRKMNLTKIIATAIFAALAPFVFAACASTTSDNKRDENSVTFATSFKVQNLDPLKSAHYFLIEYGVAETPLFIDDDANIKPHLLASYALIDERRWRLIIRPNVRFHNGKILSAEKFAAAMNRQLENSPATKSVLPAASVRVVSETELVLITENPEPNVPGALADEAVFPIYDVESIEPAGSDAEKIIASGSYTGPYQLKSLDDRDMRLEKFTDYWQGAPPLDAVVVRFVPDVQARILTVQTGEADIALYPPTEAKRMLENNPGATFVVTERAGGGPRLFFNTRRPPFDDANARRAVSLGINYQSLAKDVLDSVYETANGFYPPQYAWAIANQRTDAPEAKRLLDEAGWKENAEKQRSKNGANLTVVLIVHPQQPDWVTIATAIQAQLRLIGFDVKIRQVEDINATLKNSSEWNLAISSPGIVTGGGAPDPDLRDYFSTGAPKNHGGVSDTELDRLISDLSVTFDTEQRKNLLRRIQQIVIAEKAFEARPVFSRSKAIVGRRFKNYRPSPRLHHVTFQLKPGEN